MFTGIIETIGKVESLFREDGNLRIGIRSSISKEMRIDQSVSHNGVCLTVVEILNDVHYVQAIDETLKRTNLGKLSHGDRVNLERCVTVNARLDGHIVQGHVDTIGVCRKVVEEEGSWLFHFTHPDTDEYITVPKGSITINGVSLTVVDSAPGSFSVAIIPYTYAHTNFHQIKTGDLVNLEFDIIGKYVAAYMKRAATAAIK
jgi:riboflavin synthase